MKRRTSKYTLDAHKLYYEDIKSKKDINLKLKTRIQTAWKILRNK